MGKSLIFVGVLATAASCAMYGDPAPRPKNPPPIRHAKIDDPPAPPKVYRAECEFHVKAIAKPPKRDIPRSNDHVVAGDAAIATAGKTDTPVASRGPLLIDSIQQYGAALERDPYNAEATLKLARAYDAVLQKGCALALLDRLAKLADNPTFERAASAQIDDVENHRAWFGDYRTEALKAVKR